MIPQKDRIESAIRHIQTSVDIDPWAMELAVEALKAQDATDTNVGSNGDTIYRKAAIELIERMKPYHQDADDIAEMIANMPSAQPERKTGKWIERNPQNSDKCRLIECDKCGFSHIVGFNVPYEHWIENRNFCERCGADMRGDKDDQR